MWIRTPGSRYEPGVRSWDMLKVIRRRTIEAVIVDTTAGKGRHAGRVGAFVCELDNAVRFKVGTGIPDPMRAAPPAPGTRITLEYKRLTKTGKPREPAFLRLYRGGPG